VYERESTARVSSSDPPRAFSQQNEQQVFEVLKTVVSRSPQGRDLLNDVMREVENILRFENLRKF
jgi:hypothetical protein